MKRREMIGRIQTVVAAGAAGAVALWAAAAGAQPFPGGLPQCVQETEECEEDLTECDAEVTECDEDLTECEEQLTDCGGPPASGQDRQVVEGEDGNPAFGAPLAYLDNGDGTITDLNTRLMWTKKVQRDQMPDAGNLHDADNCYPWRGSCSVSEAECGTDVDCPARETCDAGDCQVESPNGLTIFEWVAELNAQGFAGHSDWRIPNVKELQSIVDYGRDAPSIDPAFHGASCGASCTDLGDPDCACTASSDYWSATNSQFLSTVAWFVNFSGGIVSNFGKTNFGFVRAVRGGS